MGRLRDGYEIPLFHGISEEVVDLFGIDDCTLHKHFTAVQNKDPIWNEPASTTVKYKQYKIKCMTFDPTSDAAASEFGTIDIFETKIYVAMAHLLKAGIIPDEKGDYVDEGDMIEIKKTGPAQVRSLFYDIIKALRVGYVNDESDNTGYELQVKRNWKYVPERKDYNT